MLLGNKQLIKIGESVIAQRSGVAIKRVVLLMYIEVVKNEDDLNYYFRKIFCRLFENYFESYSYGKQKKFFLINRSVNRELNRFSFR
jgi:hypothetical protein